MIDSKRSFFCEREECVKNSEIIFIFLLPKWPQPLIFLNLNLFRDHFCTSWPFNINGKWESKDIYILYSFRDTFITKKKKRPTLYRLMTLHRHPQLQSFTWYFERLTVLLAIIANPKLMISPIKLAPVTKNPFSGGNTLLLQDSSVKYTRLIFHDLLWFIPPFHSNYSTPFSPTRQESR